MEVGNPGLGEEEAEEGVKVRAKRNPPCHQILKPQRLLIQSQSLAVLGLGTSDEDHMGRQTEVKAQSHQLL